MATPLVGEVVLYWHQQEGGLVPIAAIVTAVHGDRNSNDVSLHLFWPATEHDLVPAYADRRVEIDQHKVRFDPRPKAGMWCRICNPRAGL